MVEPAWTYAIDAGNIPSWITIQYGAIGIDVNPNAALTAKNGRPGTWEGEAPGEPLQGFTVWQEPHPPDRATFDARGP